MFGMLKTFLRPCKRTECQVGIGQKYVLNFRKLMKWLPLRNSKIVKVMIITCSHWINLKLDPFNT